MRPTRRLWAIAGLAVGLAILAVVLGRPLALAGTVLIGAWILSQQYLFYRAVTALSDDLSVTQSPAQIGVRTDDTIPTTLTATLDSPTRLACAVDGGLPTAASATDSFGLRLEPENTTASTTVNVHWPVAGRHTFDPATVTVTDDLFEETIPVGSTPTVTVEPRGPRNLHVGESGDRIATAYGEHDAGRLGSGLEPAELREYVPGDTADRIDWNATARLGTPYVREFEAETDRKTILVVNHREALAHGHENETKLDYVREVALAIADSARQLGDPLGMVSVGDDGVTNRLDPTTKSGRYATIRRTILDLEPTAGHKANNTNIPESVRNPHSSSKTLADVRRSLTALEGDDDTFARVVRPFYADRQTYVDRIDSDPLYTAVRTTLARETGRVFTVLCTDDSTPAELRETVKLASREGGTVLVLLAPTVLYEPGGLADVERAYERYVDFEELRRELARLDGVTALEVGPGDRLATVLSAGRDRSAQRRVGGGLS